MAFGKAFAAARKAGKKEFTYNGKKYNTKLAADTPKNAPTPTPKPSQAKAKQKASPSGTKAGSSKAQAKKPVPATGRDRLVKVNGVVGRMTDKKGQKAGNAGSRVEKRKPFNPKSR